MTGRSPRAPASLREPPWNRGAEASLRPVDWWGLPALEKDREPKEYRPKELDDRLRLERFRTEVRLLVEARRLGVRTPLVYEVDGSECRLVLERLPGPTLKELLTDSEPIKEGLLASVQALGSAIGRLHAGGVAHGDLTSSNVLFPDGLGRPPALLDLSMGTRHPGVEELGIDLHLVEEDLKAMHPNGPRLFRAFLQGYTRANPAGAGPVRRRAREIKGRIRYA